ncbi:MAG: DUF2971 domain-containing protein [Armatimonadota bacterium]|nr:DUF2971 domain-containing protein [Armatimonadota bacterium]
MELYHGLDVLQIIANRQPQLSQNVRDIIDQFLTSPGTLETDAFQMSFSGNPDDLGQWRGYAANGMGCSVVTDALAIKNIADVAGWVIYDPVDQEAFATAVLSRLSGVTDLLQIAQAVAAAASYMKHEGFSSEQEFRLLIFPDLAEVKFRESTDRLVPSVEILDRGRVLPIDRVIIGPGWQLSGLPPKEVAMHHVPQAIQRLLSANGLVNTNIESSQIPYDPR